MKNTFSGIILGGSLQLDEQIHLADQCRVHVTIVPLDQDRNRWQHALTALEELRASNPIHSGNQRFSREQLHERN